MDLIGIERLARLQGGLVARRQLLELGCDADRVRNQLAAGRWSEQTSTVLSTFTGSLPWTSKVWLGALHAGGDALIGGLTALQWWGLRNWQREEVTVLVDDQLSFEEVPGLRFFRTRRPLGRLRSPRSELPIARVESAALLFAAYDRSPRTAQGLLAAVVQQRLATADSLTHELASLKPLRRAKLFRATLEDLAGGAQSLAEIDVGRMCRKFGLPRPQRQRRRRDSGGRVRFLDVEWRLADGTALVLEVDGAFHMEVEHWEDDLARHRRLVHPGRLVVRCTAREVRDEPEILVADLRALGLRRVPHDALQRVVGHTTP